MSDDEIAAMRAEMHKLVEAGFANIHEGEKEAYSLTSAGVDYVETVLTENVEDRLLCYALGRMQGLVENRIKCRRCSRLFRTDELSDDACHHKHGCLIRCVGQADE